MNFARNDVKIKQNALNIYLYFTLTLCSFKYVLILYFCVYIGVRQAKFN